MGQDNSTLEERKDQFKSTHTKVKELARHPRFGQVEIYKDKSDNLVLIKESIIFDRDEYDLIKKRVEKRRGRDVQFINRLGYSDFFIERVWCSDNYHACVAYEYHERTLEQELDDRSKLPDSNFKVKVCFFLYSV